MFKQIPTKQLIFSLLMFLTLLSGCSSGSSGAGAEAPNGVIDSPTADQTILTGENVSFTGTGTDQSNNAPLTFLWDFGGGAANATLEDPGAVTFSTSGTFAVTFTVTDSTGLSDPTPDTRTITVTDPAPPVSTPNQAPNGVINTPAANQAILTGESLSFTGTGTDPENSTPLTFLWNFGGGAANATVQNPGAVVFNTPGVFTVTFTVTDSLGLSDSTPGTRTITVTEILPSVALLAADGLTRITDVEDKLNATGRFSSVTVVDLETTTPTLAELQAFDAVLVWSNLNFANNILLGDNLADYVDGGGGVVQAAFSYNTGIRGIAGRYLTDNYYAIPAGSRNTSGTTQVLGTVFKLGHPIMDGVTSFNGGSSSFRPNTLNVVAGATRIADWDDGTPLVAIRTDFAGQRVDLGFFPPSSDVRAVFWDATTDGVTLMANALRFAASRLPSVALLAVDSTARVAEVEAKLNATGRFSSVTVVDLGTTTPTLAELQAFDAVLVWSNNFFTNNILLGDNLADYVDGGGGVVQAVFSYNPGSLGIAGRYLSDNYYAIPSASGHKSGTTQVLGTVFNSGHPIMNGVTSFNGGTSSFRPNTLNVVAGATRIADWDDGTPLVAIRTNFAGQRVDLGFFPPSSDSIADSWDATTDGVTLMANALSFAAK